MKLAWITDPHLDCVPEHVVEAFGRQTNNMGADCAVVTGDIADGPQNLHLLAKFGQWFRGHVYFVLGNHDYYKSSIAECKRLAAQLCEEYPNLVFLDTAGVVELTRDVALVGNGGFYDARAGSVDSRFDMDDFRIIKELGDHSYHDRFIRCRQIAEDMAKEIRRPLLDAANQYSHVYFATHVPPFTGASWHKGRRSDSETLPWFTNLTFGRELADVADSYSDIQFTVLCGHSHSSGEYQHFDNLRVLTGAAEYCYPSVWKLIEV